MPHLVSRRRVAHAATWAVPATLTVGAAPALAASQENCEDTGLQPFPGPITVYDRDNNQPATTNLLPYTENGWTARRVGGVDWGTLSFNNFEGGGFRNTMDPVARDGAELHTYITATAQTIPGCTYTVSTRYEFTGITNERPMVAWIHIDGVDYAQLNSSSSPVSGTRRKTFTATSETTTIGLHTRVTGTATSNVGADINMSEPTITCSCAS